MSAVPFYQYFVIRKQREDEAKAAALRAQAAKPKQEPKPEAKVTDVPTLD